MQTYPHNFEQSFELASWLLLSEDADGFGCKTENVQEALELVTLIDRQPEDYRDEWEAFQEWKMN